MRRTLLVALAAGLLLSSCGSQPLTPITPPPTTTSTPDVNRYEDGWLCFTVEVPTGWIVDGVPGGFASFSASKASFNIANVYLGETPTLEQALDELERGSSSQIQEVRDVAVDGQPALWVTLAPDAEFQFVATVIAPDCGGGHHALFISARGTNRGELEMFLTQIHLME